MSDLAKQLGVEESTLKESQNLTEQNKQYREKLKALKTELSSAMEGGLNRIEAQQAQKTIDEINKLNNSIESDQENIQQITQERLEKAVIENTIGIYKALQGKFESKNGGRIVFTPKGGESTTVFQGKTSKEFIGKYLPDNKGGFTDETLVVALNKYITDNAPDSSTDSVDANKSADTSSTDSVDANKSADTSSTDSGSTDSQSEVEKTLEEKKAEAEAYNKRYSDAQLKLLSDTLGFSVSDYEKVTEFQKRKNLKIDGKLGPNTIKAMGLSPEELKFGISFSKATEYNAKNSTDKEIKIYLDALKVNSIDDIAKALVQIQLNNKDKTINGSLVKVDGKIGPQSSELLGISDKINIAKVTPETLAGLSKKDADIVMSEGDLAENQKILDNIEINNGLYIYDGVNLGRVIDFTSGGSFDIKRFRKAVDYTIQLKQQESEGGYKFKEGVSISDLMKKNDDLRSKAEKIFKDTMTEINLSGESIFVEYEGLKFNLAKSSEASNTYSFTLTDLDGNQYGPSIVHNLGDKGGEMQLRDTIHNFDLIYRDVIEQKEKATEGSDYVSESDIKSFVEDGDISIDKFDSVKEQEINGQKYYLMKKEFAESDVSLRNKDVAFFKEGVARYLNNQNGENSGVYTFVDTKTFIIEEGDKKVKYFVTKEKEQDNVSQ